MQASNNTILEDIMQRALSLIFGIIGVFNIGVAAFQLIGGMPGLGTASIGVFGLAMLGLGIGLCPRCTDCRA